MVIMDISNELSKHLHNEEELIVKRLCLAENVFLSSQMAIPNKEEIIFGWLCDLATSPRKKNSSSFTKGNVDLNAVWRTLQACIASKRVHRFSVLDLQPSIKKAIIQLLSDHLERNVKDESEFLILCDCVVSVLESVSFQRYLRQDAPLFYTFLKNLLTCLQQSFVQDNLKVRVIMSVRTFFRESVSRHNLDSNFLREALFPIVNLIVTEDETICNSPLANEVKKSFEQILFPKSMEFIQFLDALFHTDRKVPDLKSHNFLEREKHPIPFNIMEALRESHEFLPTEAVVVTLYRTIYESLVGSLKTYSMPSAFQMFVCMCHLAGIKTVHINCKINQKKLNENIKQALTKPTGLSMKILKGLVDVLLAKQVPLNSEISGNSFLEWLQLIVESLLPNFVDIMDRKQLFKLLESFTLLHPFTVEANMENILSFILCKPITEAEESACTDLLQILFRMYHKMNRIHKLFAVFLTCLENGMLKYFNESDRQHLDVCDWIPSDLYPGLSEFATLMPSESAISTFETLLLHLRKAVNSTLEIIEQEGHCAEGFSMVHIVCKLSCAMFKGIRMVENSVTPNLRKGFCNIMRDFKECLHVMGQSLLKSSNVSSLKPFLELSYYWAAEALLLKQYATVGRTALLESIGSRDAPECRRVSLSLTHPYLNDEEWEIIRERTVACSVMECTDSLMKLDFQLLCSLQLFVNPLPTETSTLAKHSFTHVMRKSCSVNKDAFLTKEMVFDVVLLSKMLNISEVLELSECLVASLLSQDSKYDNMETITLLSERRTLACALIFSTLDSLNHALKVSKRKKSEATVNRFTASRRLLQELKSCTRMFVEAEVKQSSEVAQTAKSAIITMTEYVGELLKSALASKEEEVEESGNVYLMTIKNHLRLLQALPLHCLLFPSRYAIFLSLLSLAVDCNRLPPSTDRSQIISMLYDRILVGLAERKLFVRKHQHFNQPLLHRYLAHTFVGLNVSSCLLEMLMSEAIEDENVLEYISEMVSFLTANLSKGKSSKECFVLATLLLQNINKKKRPFESSSDAGRNEDHHEKVRSAVEALVFLLCQLIGQHHGKTKELLHLYALSLDFLVKSKIMNKVEQSLAPCLEDYCSVAVAKLQSSNIHQRKAAEALLSTIDAYHSLLEKFIPSSFLRDIWSSVIHGNFHSDGIVKLLSHYVSQEMMDELIIKTVEYYRTYERSTVETSSSYMMELWCAFLNYSSSTKAHADLWIFAVRRLLDNLHSLSRVPPCSLLTFVHKIISTTEIVMDMEMIDQCLLVLNVVDLPMSAPEFVPVAEKYLCVLSALFFHRQVFALDSVPNIFPKLQNLMRKLGNLSRARGDLSQASITSLADLAYNIEKFVSSFTKPDFKAALKRVAAYLIADVISVFEAFTLFSDVKVHFQNIVYILMSMIDNHSIEFLLRTMSPASVEIFKSLHATYTKFHAFKGKI